MATAPSSSRTGLQSASLRLRIFLLFAALMAGALLALTAGLYFAYARSNQDPSALNAVVIGGVIAGFVILGLIAGVWLLFDENVAKPIERLAGELRARTHAHVQSELENPSARHLGDLAPAAAALTRHLNEARNELAEAIARETTRLAIEKERLVTLLADIPVGVLLCSADHQLVLYNGQALELLGEANTGDAPGLNRKVFDYLQEGPIRHAYENLLQFTDPDTELEVICTTRDTGRQLTARIRLLAELLGTIHEKKPGYVLTLRESYSAPQSLSMAPRTVVYDFELLAKQPGAQLSNTPLDDLVYVVFDTETTGLLPSRGDEIVQIAAVRIVNGKRVEKEVLDTLVNPGRAIPVSSTEIHGISDAMVVDAPPIEKVARRLHKFAQGAVLVAHNAPFDLAFLRRDEQHTGVRFDNPILDTVLLSAIVFGQSESHSLDALTARLGIRLPEGARHTAIGDATATAEVLLKLLPALKARGLITFGDVLQEMRRHGRLLKDSNAW
jgi:DNA polymerase-3 subunit epsilon